MDPILSNGTYSPAPDPELAGERANILIVDDRPEKLLVFKTILEDLNQNIVTLQSGEEALRWLLDNECAVVLLDVNMPGMDGFETAELIRARRKSAHTPIIFITAHSDEIHSERGYALGAVDFLLSPAAPNVLRSKVAVFVQLFDLARQNKLQADARIALVREQAARSTAEESTRRANFLADAGQVLISSLNVDALMLGTTRLVVPILADFSAMTVVHDDSTSVRTACADAGDGTSLPASITGDPVWVQAVNDVLATRQQKLLENLSGPTADEPVRVNGADGRGPGLFSQVLMLPLVARAQIHGVLCLALGCSGRKFGSSEIALAADIGTRAALALDNCLLYKEIQETDRRKNEFLATLSHELRNPLAPMRTAIHALHLSGEWPAGAHELRAMLERQLDHLTRLVDDLLDVSRITQGKIHLRRESVDLVKKISYALENCRTPLEDAGHELLISLPGKPVIVDGDRVRLQQIFENLIINACRYTEPRGQIDVSLVCEDGEAVIRIRDTGVGISRAMMPRIFDMFAQADSSSDRTRHGLGIGLALVRNLVQLHGGSIDATSEGLGKGSEFTVRLPLMAADTVRGDVPSPAATDHSAAQAAALRILVVDDNADAAESMAILLGILGHRVEVAQNGHSALAVARSLNPELVFLDIGLPEMDGYEVARRLRREAGITQAKLIALSGYGTENDQMQSRNAGFIRHLVKPVDPRELPAIIALAVAPGEA
jgi:signal transduction histidine kinase/DNA-binding response OmpR family regulator